MKRILKLTSFILLCAMLLSFAACDMAVENGDASDSDSDAVGSEEIPSDKVTEKNTEKKTDKKPSVTKVVKGYVLSASTPADRYGNGMFLVYKLSDGRLFVFDGGNGSVKDFMISALQDIAGTQKVKVAAWVMTHDHGDHYGALIEYYYANAATINQVLDVEEFWMNPMNSEG